MSEATHQRLPPAAHSTPMPVAPPPPANLHKQNRLRGPAPPDPRARRAPERVLPDPSVCRARFIGFADYVDCLVDRPLSCPHMISMGRGFLCRHPQRNEIVLRTTRST